MRTYRLNHPRVPDDHIIVQDIRTLKKGQLKRLLGRKRLDVLIGAPPCQAYSSAGFRSKKSATGYRPEADERNFLFESMIAAALELRPRLFLKLRQAVAHTGPSCQPWQNGRRSRSGPTETTY